MWYNLAPVQTVQEPRPRWGLVRRREVWLPTWRGWLLLGLSAAALGLFFLIRIHAFLAESAPVPGGLLAVEGWGSDETFEAAIAEFHRHPYERLYVTGGPVDTGSFLSEYKSYAERGAAILEKLGLSTNQVQAVPAPKVRRDRTYAAAESLGRWLREHGQHPSALNVLTEDTHARRSRLLYQKALGKRVAVGVIALPPADYDPKRWWRSSAGVRSVIGETIAYFYARVFFWPVPQLP